MQLHSQHFQQYRGMLQTIFMQVHIDTSHSRDARIVQDSMHIWHSIFAELQ